MNSTVSRGIIVVVLITCTMLVLWWVTPRPEDQGGWLVTSVSSGDTITVERDGDMRTVHLLGIWAPEAGECGFNESRQYLVDGIQGVEVVLKEYDANPGSPAAEPSADTLTPWELYVEFSRLDVGLAQIEAGHAVASGDVHGRSDQYRAAQRASQDAGRYACA